ncbi:type II toxin-antitoxin system PemK/MazF family toxin [Caldisalinibacter kiritimatiensis]|uniref:Transcriptional modulator of MazE/toxin, MazF n=1 Tax=Caldisalinibacter kiritimatiensis TaxID=1304284 RepID=R1CRM8_9FIRM|nr:type II toxin-antitoxin system PemK/MazF family toxin [Caldisalinibacter kiritimatiensis]EOC99358.1 transcriptional modulator of MazE/toxin, MazF [Caldisalinibacter kiritimatiensis]
MARSIDLSKTQQYLEWLKTKLYLDSNASRASKRVVKRGEVYRCNLGLGIGSEECKERPCVILQSDAGNVTSPNTIVAPITHTGSTLPVVVPIANKYNESGKIILDGNVLLGNIVCVSKARLGDFVTKLDSSEMEAVDEAIAISVDIKRHYDKLKNILDDKVVYIGKLKDKISVLEDELSKKEDELNRFISIKEEFGIEDMQEFEKQIREAFLK